MFTVYIIKLLLEDRMHILALAYINKTPCLRKQKRRKEGQNHQEYVQLRYVSISAIQLIHETYLLINNE